MIDVTDRILAAYDVSDVKAGIKQTVLPASAQPQATIMFVKLAQYHSHNINGELPGFHDFDDALNFQTLAACLSRYIDPATTPSLNEPVRADPQVSSLFQSELMKALNAHQAACIRNGLWRIYYDPTEDRFHACLTRRRRLSAQLALNVRAQEEWLDDIAGKLISSGKASIDDVYFAFASSAEHLRFVTQSTPQSWADFTAAAGFTSEELTAYVGFLVFLSFAADAVSHRLSYDKDFLLKLRDIFSEAFSCSVLSDDALMRLMDLFSLPPVEAAAYLLPVPFFRLGNQYLRYDGFLRIMSPAMGLLTIVIRKDEAAWSRTLGSTLAHAADIIAASLPKHPRVEVAVRRVMKDKGDIDLAIYDTVSRHMLVCEVKTVYDKHRTVNLMHRFRDAKVNVTRAVAQLRSSAAVIRSGDLTMASIFGRNLPQPVHIRGVLLTWLDPIDLTVDSPDEDILSLNFATFRYLFKRAYGDISAMIRGSVELRNHWCVAHRRPLDLGQPQLRCDLEVQFAGVVDAVKDTSRLALSPMTMAELLHFSALPDNWPALPEYSKDSVSYLADTRRALATM